MDWVQIGVVTSVLVALTTIGLNSLGILGKLFAFLAAIWKSITHPTKEASSGSAIPPRTIVAIPQSRINALWWSIGTAGERTMLQVIGDFNVTNTWSKDVRLAGALLRYKPRFLFSRIVRGDSSVKDLKSVYFGNYPIPPNGMTSLRVSFHFPHKARRPENALVADLAVIDQFNNYHWIKGLRFKHPDAMFS